MNAFKEASEITSAVILLNPFDLAFAMAAIIASLTTPVPLKRLPFSSNGDVTDLIAMLSLFVPKSYAKLGI